MNLRQGLRVIGVVFIVTIAIVAMYFLFVVDDSGLGQRFKNWKTYRNETYWFEFMYPNNLVLDDARPDNVFLKKSIDFPPEFTVQITKHAGEWTAASFADVVVKALSACSAISENFLLNGESGAKVTAGQCYDRKDIRPAKEVIVIFEKNGFLYQIDKQEVQGQGDDFRLFNQILSTFKFTK